MKKVNSAEFNITNVCNLSCTGCNRFNDMNLTGYEDWKKHRKAYENFSKHVKVKYLHVLGGEPLMHPMINDILYDVRSWYPTQNIRLVTNGLLLHKVQGIFKSIVENKISLGIYIHNKEWRMPVYNKLRELTKSELKLKWINNREGRTAGHWPRAEFDFNGCEHSIDLAEHFYQNSLQQPLQDRLQPYESDAEKAFNVCQSRCPTFNDGKFYKCPTSHALPDVVRQKNNIHCTQKQKELIDTFPHVNCDDVQSFPDDKFASLLSEKIDQCSLCPEKFKFHKIAKMDISPNYF